MNVRHAAVAGQFYPGNAKILRRDIEAYLEESGVVAAPMRVVAVVAPHAGYMYSGPTAGFAFARVRDKRPARIILLGRSHRHSFKGASIYMSGAFETPLGRLPVDEAWAERLATGIGVASPEPHQHEHCLEVMLPFIQVALGDIPILPILFGEDPTREHLLLGERLAERMEVEDFVVASTDLSHYLPEHAANQIDHVSINGVLSRDVLQFTAGITAGKHSMCGGTAVAVAMACANTLDADEWRLLDYRTSGQVSGDYERVVGYASISMEKSG